VYWRGASEERRDGTQYGDRNAGKNLTKRKDGDGILGERGARQIEILNGGMEPGGNGVVPLEFDDAVADEAAVERHGSEEARRPPEPREIPINGDAEAPVMAGDERNPQVPHQRRRLEIVPTVEDVRLRGHAGIRFDAVEEMRQEIFRRSVADAADGKSKPVLGNDEIMATLDFEKAGCAFREFLPVRAQAQFPTGKEPGILFRQRMEVYGIEVERRHGILRLPLPRSNEKRIHLRVRGNPLEKRRHKTIWQKILHFHPAEVERRRGRRTTGETNHVIQW